jgi:Zn-dependent peptidase ImmA (M78 family)
VADVRTAILRAAQAADRLHEEFGTAAATDGEEGRVDVFGMMARRELPVLFRPLDKLLGAYLNEGSPGVIITTKRQLPVQRWTAAHELGHAVLNHKPSLDQKDVLARSPFVDRESGGYDLQEIQANAFASRLLTPDWLLAKHVRRQQWKPADLSKPDTVYQLSLRLGASYAATCHALMRSGALKQPGYEALLAVKPRDIKKRLVAPYVPGNWYGDAWVITERDDGFVLEGSRSDLVVINVLEHSGSGYLWRMQDLADVGLAVVSDGRASNPDKDLIGGMVFRKVVAESQNGAAGSVHLEEVRPWLADEPLHALNLEVDFTGPLRAGLLRAQREAALQGVA